MEGARLWLPRAVAGLAFALYAWAAPPGPYWLDSPELSAAALRLGSPHETGFPLYCLLAKAVSFMPLGELAWRLNVLSALCAALAVLFISRLVLEAASSRSGAAGLVGAVCAGVTLAVSLTFFRQATVAEVYAPTAAALALTLLLFARVARGGGADAGLALAVVGGLGLALHASYRLLVPLPVCALFLVRLRRGARWPLLAPALFVAVGAALYLYLPVRAATGRTSEVDWGHPRTAEALYEHASAAGIRDAFAEKILSTEPLVVTENARRLGADIGDQLGPICLLAALAGLVSLLAGRPRRWLLGFLLLVIAGDAVYAFWVNPMGLEDLQNGVPLAIGVAAAAGLGVAWFSRRLGPAAAYGGAALSILVALQPALISLPPIWSSARSDLPRRFAESGLDAVPPRGVALTQTDSTSSGLLFLTAAEGARPDAAALVRQQLRDVERTARVLSASATGAVELEPARPLRSILRGDRPIAWELGVGGVPGGFAPLHGVPLARLVPLERARAILAGRDDLGAAYREVGELFDDPGAADRIARRMRAHVLTNLGRAAVFRRQLERAAFLFESALAVRPRHAAAMVNRGVIFSYAGDLESASRWTEAALEVEPNRVQALYNAARYRLALGQREKARRHLERGLRLQPDHPRAAELREQLQ